MSATYDYYQNGTDTVVTLFNQSESTRKAVGALLGRSIARNEFRTGRPYRINRPR